jgi:hypothetical protein
LLSQAKAAAKVSGKENQDPHEETGHWTRSQKHLKMAGIIWPQIIIELDSCNGDTLSGMCERVLIVCEAENKCPTCVWDIFWLCVWVMCVHYRWQVCVWNFLDLVCMHKIFLCVWHFLNLLYVHVEYSCVCCTSELQCTVQMEWAIVCFPITMLQLVCIWLKIDDLVCIHRKKQQLVRFHYLFYTICAISLPRRYSHVHIMCWRRLSTHTSYIKKLIYWRQQFTNTSIADVLALPHCLIWSTNLPYAWLSYNEHIPRLQQQQQHRTWHLPQFENPYAHKSHVEH